MKKQLLILALLLPLLGGCIYDFEAELTGDQYTVVVEGDIIVGGTTTIRFSRLNPELMGDKEGGNGQSSINDHLEGSAYNWGLPIDFTARVEGEDGTVVEAEGLGGTCRLDTRSLSPNVRYRLCLEDKQKGHHYVSTWEAAVSAPVIDSLSYKRNLESLDVRVTFHSDGTTPYYCIAYDEQWEYHAYATTNYRYVAPGWDPPEDGYAVFPPFAGSSVGWIYEVWEPYPNYTCWNTAMAGISTVVTTGAMVDNKMVDYVFRTINQYDSRISVAYRPMVGVRMISEDSYAYWKSLEETSSQTGDLFAPIPSLLRGNITNEDAPASQVIGYVGVSVQANAEMLIKANDIFLYRQPQDVVDYIKRSTIGAEGGVLASEMYYRYSLGYRPWRMEFPDADGKEAEGYYVWIAERCMDCRVQGGTTTKPEGWPEE